MRTIEFKSPEFGDLHVGVKEGIIWFSVKDICEALNLDEREVSQELSPDDIYKDIDHDGIPFINFAGLVEKTCVTDAGRRYRRWVISDILPKAFLLLYNESYSPKLEEVLACIKDVITDYPTCAIESNYAEMDLVHYNVEVLSRFYYTMTSGPELNPYFPISPICK